MQLLLGYVGLINVVCLAPVLIILVSESMHYHLPDIFIYIYIMLILATYGGFYVLYCFY